VTQKEKTAFLNRIGEETGPMILVHRYGFIMDQFASPAQARKYRAKLGDVILKELGEKVLEKEYLAWIKGTVE
jgi:hypothetical protein